MPRIYGLFIRMNFALPLALTRVFDPHQGLRRGMIWDAE